jgi:hypothetical protein
MKAEGSLRLAARAMSALLRLAGGRASLPAMLRNASFRIPELGSRRGSDMRARGERLRPIGGGCQLIAAMSLCVYKNTYFFY